MFLSKVMDKWAYERRVELDFSRSGKPTDNAAVESFNGRLRQECLNAHWLLSLADALHLLNSPADAPSGRYNAHASAAVVQWIERAPPKR
ncbi:transposase [Ottowia sp. GY511]|nr:transposase [Ottowia sp. GY511]